MGFSFPDNFRASVANVIEDWNAFSEAHDQESPVSIRVNPKKLSKPPELAKIPWNTNGYYLKERPRFIMDPLFHAGVYYPQEPGSMLLDHIVRQLPVEKTDLCVLDLCAAPGGKSSLLLDWLDGEGFLVSNEVIGKRAKVLQENLDKWGHTNRLVSNSDPKHFGKLGKVFDVVVIDAPCSGEGMFRKEADAVRMWSEELVEHCHQRQRRIVRDAIACLKPGGFLIYSTCTYNARENEEVLHPLIEDHGAESLSPNVPDTWNIAISNTLGVWGCRCLPHRVASEGFFIAALQFPGKAQNAPKKRTPKRPPIHSMKVPEALASWLIQPNHLGAIEHNKRTFILPSRYIHWALDIATKIHVLTIGVEAGRIIRAELIPAPPLALCLDLDQNSIPFLELSDALVIDYLRKEDPLKVAAQNGWTLCRYGQTPIGWAKTVDGKLKNHWPKEWRIIHATNLIERAIP